MARLMDPVYRRRAEQFVADAVLAAAAFALAFVLRFLDVPFGIPHRYVTMLAGSIAFVAIGKSIVFEILGLPERSITQLEQHIILLDARQGGG